MLSKGLSSLLRHHNSKASILQHSVFLYSPTLTSIHDYSIDKDIQHRQRQLLYDKDDFTGRENNRSGLKTGERIPRKWLWLKDRTENEKDKQKRRLQQKF